MGRRDCTNQSAPARRRARAHVAYVGDTLHAGPSVHGETRRSRSYHLPVSRRRQSAVGPLMAAVAVAAVTLGVTLFTRIDWFYPRLVTTVAIMVIVVLATLVAWRLLPASWRPRGFAPFAIACIAGYAFLRIGASAGWTELMDHRVLERVGGEADDFPTWLFAALGGAGVFLVVAAFNAWVERSPGDDAPR